MKIKLCGFTERESLQTAINLSVDFIGFVFYENSVRNISYQKAAKLAKLIPESIEKVAVVVNPSIAELKLIEDSIKPDFFQLHGDENIEFIKEIKQNFSQIKLIKALNINEEADFKKAEKFLDLVDFFLFDAKMFGSGRKFDWNLIKKNKENKIFKKNWFLAGGLNIENIDQALEISGANFIDISSGIEIEKGKKSSDLITNFVNKVRN